MPRVIAVIALIFTFAFPAVVVAEESVVVTSPVLTQGLSEPYIAISPDLFYPFEDRLYIEGRANPNAYVIVMLRSHGEQPVRFTVQADSSGEWVVSAKTYLSAGNWEVRAKQRVGAVTSSESNPRVIRSIVTGINLFGVNIRYVVIAGVVFTFTAVLVAVFIYFRRKILLLKRGLLEKRLRDTEERFHKGFAEMRKELMAELRDLAANSNGRPLTADEIEKRDRLLRELDDLERNLEHDITDIEKRA